MARTLLLIGAMGLASIDAFSLTQPAVMLRSSRTRAVSSLIVSMEAKGFGKPKNERKVSEVAKDRAPAAERYENIKNSGAPEFNIFLRIKGATDEDGLIKGGWYPVGLITAPSSQLVNRAIFNTEDALLQGAFRVHQKQIVRQFKTKEDGKVSKWQDLKECDLEYGYQFKDYPDEEVVVAAKPREPTEIEKMTGGLFKKLQDTVNWVPEEK